MRIHVLLIYTNSCNLSFKCLQADRWEMIVCYFNLQISESELLFNDFSVGKESTCCLIPGSGRSPGEGNGNPLQYFWLENSIDRGAWWATVHGVTKSRTRLSDSLSL